MLALLNEVSARRELPDPANPGKVINSYHPTENLRLGADYRPWSPETHFHFPDDEGRLDRSLRPPKGG